MKKKQSKAKKTDDFRDKAERILKSVKAPIEKLTDADVRKLAHELQVHQIELEMQNEELRKSQQELEDSRDKYSRLYDFAPIGYFTISDDGIILDANLTGAKMLGVERSHLINKPLCVFIVKDDQDNYYRHRRKTCKVKERSVCEVRMVRKDGTEFYVQLQCGLEQDKREDTVRCLTVMTDITERKRAEDEHRNIFDLSIDMICICDIKNGYFMKINHAFEKTLGYSEEELLGSPFYNFIHPDDIGPTTNEVEEMLANGKEVVGFENRYRCKDGSYKWLMWTAKPIPENGITYATAHDITKRKEMEETLIQSEKIKSLGMISAGISHEFNNILAVIMGAAELHGEGAEVGQELKSGLNTIIKAGENGAEIVRNMLSYAKSHENDISNFVLFDIRHILREAIDFLAPRLGNMAQARGIDYQIDREDMRVIPEAPCDPAELRGVFINIINNALDAMPDGGRLSFSTSSNDDTIFIRISDTGIGMSEEVKKSIFDPFFTTRRPEGTGLGMSISYGTMTRHGGKIEVESEEGKGTTFNLSIPIRKDAVQKVVPPEYDRRVTGRKLHILVVDDNKDICDIMGGVLTRGGHAVTIVDNGAEAIELAGEKDFDLVLCDLLMPNVQGYDVVKALNKLDKIPKIGLMTGWADLKPIDEEGTKVDFILKKPFKHAELAKHIDGLDIPA